MATRNLKKLLGDGLAGLDQSHGTTNLYSLLKAIVEHLTMSDGIVIEGGAVRDPTTPSSQITGAGNTTWNVDVDALSAIVNSVTGQVAAAADEAIHSGSQLVTNGQSCYAWAVVTESGGTLDVEYVKGAAATTGSQVAPTDAEITASVGSANWAKLALCLLNRTGDTTVTQSQDLSARAVLGNVGAAKQNAADIVVVE
jgi:hypothetical protein